MEESPKKRTADSLRAAVDTLQQFTRKRQNPEKHSLLQSILLPLFFQKRRDKVREAQTSEHKAILNAIHIIQSNHLFLAKFNKDGTAEEKQLAHLAFTTLTSFNAVIEKESRYSSLWSLFFFHPYEELQKIDIPHYISVLKPKSAQIHKKIGEAFRSQMQPNHHLHTTSSLISSEGDAIRLKAMTLLQQKGYQSLFKNWAETLVAIETAPIDLHLDPQTLIANLSMQLTPMPGTLIKIVGTFQRQKDQTLPSIPIRNSFQLLVHTDQSGYPHPSQYTGWALSEVLLPLYPHNLQQVPLYKSLYSKKEEARLLLMPDGPWVEKAKLIHQYKEKAFLADATLYIQQHERLIHLVLAAAPQEWRRGDAKKEVQTYFNLLRKHPDPYKSLYITHQTIANRLILLPFNKFLDAWIEDHCPDLFQEDPEQIQKAIIHILVKEYQQQLTELKQEMEETNDPNERIILAFIISIGRLLAKASRSIFLQYLSESFGFAPPLLNDFEQKVQAAAFQQVYAFVHELTVEVDRISLERTRQSLEVALENDCLLFQAASIETIETPVTAIINELELYYNTQYYNRLIV